jgi:serine/threonine protein phosphatase PrpC
MEDPHTAFSQLTTEIDRHIGAPGRLIENRSSGTAAVYFIYDGNEAVVANVGDCKAVIAYKSERTGDLQPLQVSVDHKPDKKEEQARIEAKGGEVKVRTDRYGQTLGPPRAWRTDCPSPGLAMSRSIGDSDLQQIGIIPDPYVQVVEISEKV